MNPLILEFFSEPSKLEGFCTSGRRFFDFKHKDNPFEYLQIAEKDLYSNRKEYRANALRYTQLALSLQIDKFLDCYNLSEYTEQNKFTISKKISTLGDLGLLSKRILKKVTKARNDLEHNYKFPDQNTAIEAYDIITMFIYSMDFYLYERKDEILFSYTGNDNIDSSSIFKDLYSVEVTLARKSMKLLAKGNPGEICLYYNEQKDLEEIISIDKKKDEYFFILSYFLNYHRLQMNNPDIFFKKLKYCKEIITNKNKNDFFKA